MNPVRYIHPDAFKGLLVLEYLRLRSTQLHQLPPLQHIGHSLTYLGLTHSMKFAGNHAQDIVLDLVFNGLKSLPLGLTRIANSVRILVFRSNAIKSIASMEDIQFVTLWTLHLSQNKITHLRPDYLIAPRLLILNLEDNNLVSLEEVTQYSWGSSLPKHDYMATHLHKIPGTVMSHLCGWLVTFISSKIKSFMLSLVANHNNNTIAWNANNHLTSVAAYIIVKGIAGDFNCEDQSRRLQWTATVLVVSILPDT